MENKLSDTLLSFLAGHAKKSRDMTSIYKNYLARETSPSLQVRRSIGSLMAFACANQKFVIHNRSTLINKGKVLSEEFRFLFRKGAIDLICYVGEVGKAGYFEIFKQNFVASRQTYDKLLKIMQKNGIIEREVLDYRPKRVNYSLSLKGMKVMKILKLLKEVHL